MIKFRCSECGRKHGVPDDAAGKKVRCGHCQNVQRVPSPASAPAAPTAAASKGAAPSPLWDLLEPGGDAASDPASPAAAAPADSGGPGVPCAHCGAALAPDAVVCLACGHDTRGGAAPAAKPKKRKRPAKARSAAPALAGVGAAIAGHSDDKERHGRDEVSKLVFMLFALCTLAFWIYLIAQAHSQYREFLSQQNVAPADAPGFPFGRVVLVLLIIATIHLVVVTPYNMLGVWLTAKLMKLRLHGSLYLNTLGWMSLPGVCASIGWLLDGAWGAGMASIIGLLLVIPAFGYLHGLRVVEAIVGYVLTVAFAGAAVVAVVMVAVGVVGAGAAALDVGTAGASTSARAPSILDRDPTLAVLINVSTASRGAFEGPSTQERPSAEETLRRHETAGAAISVSNISDRVVRELRVRVETTGAIEQTHRVDLCADGPLQPDERREVNVRFRQFTPPEHGGMLFLKAHIEHIALAPVDAAAD